MVYATIGQGPRRLLIYDHYDVQPAEPLELWHSPPFEATVRDERLVARGVADNKGNTMLRIQAIEAWLDTEGELPLSIAFVVEGEEEISSRTLPIFCQEHPEPLRFAADGSFDLVVAPLVLHYLRDWTPALRELHRLLRPGGLLVFSTHHPLMDWQEFERPSYFALERLDDFWEGVGPVQFYRWPLTAISASLAEAGFVIERLLEPQPAEEYRAVRPEWFERLSRRPWFLFVRARAEASVP